MHILITNDDGIQSPGIHVLRDALQQGGHEVEVIAPDMERSAIGHAITLRKPIWAKKTYRDGEYFGYETSGTPADCVKLGILQICTKPIDLVVSGINLGANIGSDIPYSGTVSGALEGAIMGYPAIAISSVNPAEPYFPTAGRVLVEFLKQFDPKKIPKFGALNINVPSLPFHEIQGMKWTLQGAKRFDDYFEERKDPYGNAYYWLMGSYLEEIEDPKNDDWAVSHGFVSVTPLSVFMTDMMAFKEFDKLYPSQDFFPGETL
ncbi:MAG TPA: 5'/3'-nucleotidase SurE [Thermotogota bacterium]|nr:5'/3'-nucleotidase SurE [Thermotogota bacterium]HRW91317.1 5'/3'-nucleotidase SurE [Thermotogota bacterium]